jgi:hypothetical protein
VPKLGVVGSLVWDVIYGRDPASPPIEEWGGIAYALAGFDAMLPTEWEIVPLIKVGGDLRDQAAGLLRSLEHVGPGGRCVEVPVPNNRVVLRYQSAERRCERMSGGVPGWTWSELGPMVRDLDAVYVNFISGFEMELGTARALRQAFTGPLYGDLHSLFLGMPQHGIRVLQPITEPLEWLRCFDIAQMNEDEMRQLWPDPMALAAATMGAGVSMLVVTLGPRGAVYVAAPGFEGWNREAGEAAKAGGAHRHVSASPAASATSTVRTELIPAPAIDALDPTGCGDVFGAGLFSRLLAGDRPEVATREATRLAARNALLRGAGDLARLLRGELARVPAESRV